MIFETPQSKRFKKYYYCSQLQLNSFHSYGSFGLHWKSTPDQILAQMFQLTELPAACPMSLSQH